MEYKFTDAFNKKLEESSQYINVNNKDKYLLLMDILEDTNFTWSQKRNPEYYNDKPDYYESIYIKLDKKYNKIAKSLDKPTPNNISENQINSISDIIEPIKVKPYKLKQY